jgi:ATP-dependent Lon protease
LPEEVKSKLTITKVSHVKEVFEKAFRWSLKVQIMS